MSVIPKTLEEAILRAETSLMLVEQHTAAMRTNLASCQWREAAAAAERAVMAYEAHLETVQEMYRIMASTAG